MDKCDSNDNLVHKIIVIMVSKNVIADLTKEENWMGPFMNLA